MCIFRLKLWLCVLSVQDSPSSADVQVTPQDVQTLVRESTLILQEPLEALAGPLRAYRKRLQVDLKRTAPAFLICRRHFCSKSIINVKKCFLFYLQFIIRKFKEVDFGALSPSSECPADQLQKLKLAVPEVLMLPLFHLDMSEFIRFGGSCCCLSPFKRCYQVLQTLNEAEQVCAELQQSVSGLDWRLAELQFWEAEARDVYQHLRSTDRQRRGQDPRARVGSPAPALALTEDTRRLVTFSLSLLPAGADISRSAAGGSGGHGGSGPAGDGAGDSEERAHPVPPCFCHAGPSARRCCSVTGWFSDSSKF